MSANLSFRIGDILPMEDINDMARRRYQQPAVQKTDSRRPQWYVRVRMDALQTEGDMVTTTRPESRIYLGYCDEMSKQEAKTKRDEVLTELVNKPQVLITSQIKFAEVIKVYKREALPLVRVTTRGTYESALKHVEKLGDLRMCDVTALALQRWVNSMDLVWSTRKQYLAIARIVWGCAVEWEYTQQVWPGRKVKLGVKRDVKGKDMPTVDQLRRLLMALEDPYKAMAEVALVTGLRISELRGLMWTDIGPTALVVSRRISSSENDNDILKNGKVKAFDIRPLKPIFDRVRLSLKSAPILGVANASDFIFAEAGCYSSCQKAMKIAARAAGIRTARFCWHHLRAACNTMLRQAGADSTDRLAMMGHASERQNQAYIYAEGDDLRRRGDQMLQVQSLVMGQVKGVQ